MRRVPGVQPLEALKHTSRRNTSATPLASPVTMFGSELTNATWPPSSPRAGLLDGKLDCEPSLRSETRRICGMQFPPAPRQVFITKTSSTPFVSPATRLLADE